MKWIPILTIVIKMLTSFVMGCPSDVCICKWKGGKQSVECAGQQLNALPSGMDPGTQVLNFTSNSLTSISNERFLKMDLINLQKIFLSRNQIQRINDRAFKGLSNLVELDLSDNMLTTIPTETFQDYSSLMRLSLSGNPIREIKTSAFKHLSFLTTLELSNCQVDKIDDEAFNGLDNLEWLRLDGNKITTIKGNHILPENLHGINLQGNRWSCDCKLLDVYAWLNMYNVPHVQDPTCMTPEKFHGQRIKSMQEEDLACLPTITPTTLYLEVGEGRNITLTCKISAIPEATISWWFQGNVLQNDSMLTPNIHLWYYVDEGIEYKRSELFIYNSNIEDNGTFACIAENNAGRTQANYTIRVIIQEALVVKQEKFPYELYLYLTVGAICIGFFILIISCIILIKCRRKTRRKQKNKDSGKDVALQYQNNQIKCSAMSSDSNDPMSMQKSNGSVTISDRNNSQELTMYVTSTSVNVNLNDANAVATSEHQYCSPPLSQAARNYSQDQNPDLINDAESVNKSRIRNENDEGGTDKESSGPSSLQESVHAASESNYDCKAPMIRQIPARFTSMTPLPRGLARDLYQHQVDVHLNPGCFLGPDGYPIDYGLPKLAAYSQTTPQQQNAPINYYRTLPHNRGNKLLTAANPGVRYSREAEFLTRTQPYECYGQPDLRYTAEGYPANADGTTFPSPPEGYKVDTQLQHSQVIACCPSSSNPSPHSQQQWPPYLAGFHPQLIPIKPHPALEVKRYPSQQTILMSPVQAPTVTKRCVGAQTSDPEKDTIPEQREEEATEEIKTRHLTGPLADSPDEGYVGDSQEGSDM